MAEDKRSNFDRVYGMYAGGIYRFAFFRISDREGAKDITQETFIRFWKILDSGEKVRNEKSLLYLIAYGLVVDYYRKSDKSPAPLEHIEHLEYAEDLSSSEWGENIDRKSETEDLINRLKRLKPDHRDVLLLRYVDDLEIREIAEILKETENTIRVRLHRAIKELKETYERGKTD